MGLPLNKPQLNMMLQRPTSAVSIWSRGTGKTVDIARQINFTVLNMPRSTNAIVGKTFTQMLTSTLMETITSLETIFGYTNDVDFLVRKRPTKSHNFDKPYQYILKYDYVLIFKNGTVFYLISLDGGGASIRGKSIDSFIADEGLELNKLKLDSEVRPANRGNLRYFGHVPIHHGTYIYSSMGYGDSFKWLLEKGNYLEEQGLNYREIRGKIVNLSLQLIDNKNEEYRLEKFRQINKLKAQLHWRKDKTGFLYNEADVFDNLQNVGLKYVENLRRDLADFVFLREVLNWFPEGVDEGFYPDLNRNYHGYDAQSNISYIENLDDEALSKPDSRMDGDCVTTLPLEIAIDWGGKINCMTIKQHLKSINTIRFIKNLYVKHPSILDDLAQLFCDYYCHHPTKIVYMRYDHTGNKTEANSKLTYADQFKQILEKNGWKVKINKKINPPRHRLKYLQWSRLLKNTIEAKKGRPHDTSIPIVEFNLDNCNETFTSMTNAPLLEKNGNIQKDKSSEKNPLLPQQEATHLSDTADMHIDDINITEMSMPEPIPNTYSK